MLHDPLESISKYTAVVSFGIDLFFCINNLGQTEEFENVDKTCYFMKKETRISTNVPNRFCDVKILQASNIQFLPIAL